MRSRLFSRVAQFRSNFETTRLYLDTGTPFLWDPTTIAHGDPPVQYARFRSAGPPPRYHIHALGPVYPLRTCLPPCVLASPCCAAASALLRLHNRAPSQSGRRVPASEYPRSTATPARCAPAQVAICVPAHIGGLRLPCCCGFIVGKGATQEPPRRPPRAPSAQTGETDDR